MHTLMTGSEWFGCAKNPFTEGLLNCDDDFDDFDDFDEFWLLLLFWLFWLFWYHSVLVTETSHDGKYYVGHNEFYEQEIHSLTSKSA